MTRRCQCTRMHSDPLCPPCELDSLYSSTDDPFPLFEFDPLPTPEERPTHE